MTPEEEQKVREVSWKLEGKEVQGCPYYKPGYRYNIDYRALLNTPCSEVSSNVLVLALNEKYYFNPCELHKELAKNILPQEVLEY